VVIAVHCGQDVEMVLCELFKSAEMNDKGDKGQTTSAESASDSTAYRRRQLTVEELFKGHFSPENYMTVHSTCSFVHEHLEFFEKKVIGSYVMNNLPCVSHIVYDSFVPHYTNVA